VGFYQRFYDDAGGNDRNYTIGLKASSATGPTGAWLGSLTFTHCCAAGQLWYTHDLTASLTGGSTYFLVLEAIDANPDNVIHLGASTPLVGRVPFDQKVSQRRVWKYTGGVWSVVADREPIFFVRYAEPDPNAPGTCTTTTRLEGNSYTDLVSLGASATVAVSQTFFLGQDLEASKIALPLSAVAGTGNLDLEVYDVSASAVLATVPSPRPRTRSREESCTRGPSRTSSSSRARRPASSRTGSP
jgi:hypothetical protein